MQKRPRRGDGGRVGKLGGHDDLERSGAGSGKLNVRQCAREGTCTCTLKPFKKDVMLRRGDAEALQLSEVWAARTSSAIAWLDAQCRHYPEAPERAPAAHRARRQ